MSAQTFSFTAYLYRGRNEREVPVEVTYSVTPGAPERGPTYACGGQPAEDGEVEVTDAKLADGEADLTEDEWDSLYDQACARALRVVRGHQCIGLVAGLAGARARHRRHHDSVRQRQPAELKRLKQRILGHGACAVGSAACGPRRDR